MNFKAILLTFCVLISSVLMAQKKVVLDNYYNNEFGPKTGLPYHYLWDDLAMSGFSEFGKLFTAKGAVLATLKEKPTAENLKGASIYVMVDPDNQLETPKPNYMDEIAANAIAKWVSKGGVLLLLTNDYNHAELDSFNILAGKFGMKFGKEMLHPELRDSPKNRNFESCASNQLPNHPLFKGVSKIFIKEVAPIECGKKVKPVLVENGKVLIAEAKYGKGFVLAVGDPWVYNEYIDHLILPAAFQNLDAARNMVDYLLSKAKK